MRKLQSAKTTAVPKVNKKLKLPSTSVKLGWLVRPLAILFRPVGRLAPSYFRNSWLELRQVTWPNRRETWRLTLAVFIFATVFGLAILGVDRLLDEIFKRTVLK